MNNEPKLADYSYTYKPAKFKGDQMVKPGEERECLVYEVEDERTQKVLSRTTVTRVNKRVTKSEHVDFSA